MRHTRGFTPGWYAVPRWGTPNTHPPPSFPASEGSVPRSPKNRSGAGSVRCMHWKQSNPSLAHSAKANPPPSLPACIGPVPRSPKKSQRSGIGPMHALEAIKPFPSRTARKLILPRAYLRASGRSRGAPKNRSGAGSVRCMHWKRSNPSLAHSAKTNPPPSLPACIGPVSRSPKKSQRSGIGPMHALEAIKPIPSRTARKPILPRAYLRASDRSRGARLLILLASPQPSR